jgi:multiple sugar transport system permease protein
MGYAAAIAWVLFIIVFILTVIQLRLQNRWVHYE